MEGVSRPPRPDPKSRSPPAPAQRRAGRGLRLPLPVRSTGLFGGKVRCRKEKKKKKKTKKKLERCKTASRKVSAGLGKGGSAVTAMGDWDVRTSGALSPPLGRQGTCCRQSLTPCTPGHRRPQKAGPGYPELAQLRALRSCSPSAPAGRAPGKGRCQEQGWAGAPQSSPKWRAPGEPCVVRMEAAGWRAGAVGWPGRA